MLYYTTYYKLKKTVIKAKKTKNFLVKDHLSHKNYSWIEPALQTLYGSLI